MMQKIEIGINDVTLREGDQAPLTSFNREEKKIIALMLEELGIKNMEVGFASSRADFENIKWVFEIVDENGPIIATLGRATKQDTEASIRVVKWHKNARIHIFLATSDEHMKAKFGNKAPTVSELRNWLLEQIVSEVGRAQEYKKRDNPNLEIEFSPEDATGNALSKKEDGKKYLDFESEQFNFLVTVCETAIKNGATIINTPDTLGNFLPHETEIFFKKLSEKLHHLKEEGYDFKLSAHIHNDLWMASGNAISAIRWGAEQIEVTIQGIGERAGNTPLHEIVGLITEKWHAILEGKEVVISPEIQTKLVWPVSDFVAKILNLNKALQTPFIGALSDVDGSGVHNASQNVYGGTKNKAQFWGTSMNEFFSPRWGANQIISMLKRYDIAEQKGNQLIEKVTGIACEKAEAVKALFAPNIYSLYMKERGEFELKNIDIDGNKIRVDFTCNRQDFSFSGEWEGENGFINGLINAINRFIWKEIVEVEDIKIVNKPSLRQAYEEFVTDTEKGRLSLTENFKTRVQTIIDNLEKNHTRSKQVWIAQVELLVNGEKVSSVSSASDIDYAMAKAIIDGALSEIIQKGKNN